MLKINQLEKSILEKLKTQNSTNEFSKISKDLISSIRTLSESQERDRQMIFQDQERRFQNIIDKIDRQESQDSSIKIDNIISEVNSLRKRIEEINENLKSKDHPLGQGLRDIYTRVEKIRLALGVDG